MLWVTHIVFSLLIYGIMVRFGVFPLSNWYILLVSLGAVFPDIDHPGSFVSHLNFWFRLSSKAISLGGHRGPTHTIWANILAFPIAIIVFRWLGIGGFVEAGLFVIGYLSHLIADSLTVSGVAWFSPLDKHRIRGPVKTGSVFEVLLFLLFSVLVLYLFGVTSLGSLYSHISQFTTF